MPRQIFEVDPLACPQCAGRCGSWRSSRRQTGAQLHRPAIEFQRDFGALIYIGEFSAIRWASDDSAHRYLRDVIEIFEEQGWDWAYHAFREWNGWSVEHGGDKNDAARNSTPTSREKLLREWFTKNHADSTKPATR